MRRYLPIVVFAAVAAASLATAVIAFNSAREATQIKFDAAADDALARIEARLELHQSLLRAAHAFVETRGGTVDRPEFRRFIDQMRIETRYSGVRGVGFARLVAPGGEGAVEQEIESNYEIRQPIWPEETDADWRAVIVLLEPLDERNRVALGYDMYSEPVRRDAMARALETGEPAATGMVHLVQNEEGNEAPGFLVYMPLRARTEEGSDGTPRATSADGFVYAPFRAAELFNAALGRLPVLPLAIEIHDGDPAEGALLFRGQASEDEDWHGQVRATRQIRFGGRVWTATFRPARGFEAPTTMIIPFAIGLVGLLLAFALAMAAKSQQRAVEASAALHRTMESSLMEKDLMLQEMKHRIKNSITRVLAMARQTAAHAPDLATFTESFSARLQAMAASQDMLTRSRWQKADLGELLVTELQQVFGKDMDRENLSGPTVELDEATTQALGLTFHELATNALKYADADAAGVKLEVNWKVVGSRSARRLVLTWSEKSAGKAVAPAKTGFGTKLIDMNIKRELGGEIERRYDEEGLTVTIGVPLK
ncbi:MAG: CHASE domain-containing protein [Rhizobiaceae bacterium]|nr:CHASE domain-containing protein [Rhizobiaceae bacterium]MCV0409038.1 CHASE domain-containing protein [Rhizobiaceae bacterium]